MRPGNIAPLCLIAFSVTGVFTAASVGAKVKSATGICGPMTPIRTLRLNALARSPPSIGVT